jgi:hypothetical protein
MSRKHIWKGDWSIDDDEPRPHDWPGLLIAVAFVIGFCLVLQAIF